HTRSYGDWSSDVCSSDLAQQRRCGGVGIGAAFEQRLDGVVEAGAAGAAVEGAVEEIVGGQQQLAAQALALAVEQAALGAQRGKRSEERRVGKECRSGRAR